MNTLDISNTIFENIKHIDDVGNEFWYARELMKTLQYKRWDKFLNVISLAKIACEQSKSILENHFSQVGKMVNIGSNTKRDIKDFKLSRYACYLIAQNGDLRKKSNCFNLNLLCYSNKEARVK